MYESEPLPTEQQLRRLGEIIARAFVEIRALGWAGRIERAADLADAFHNVPREMFVGPWSRRRFREDLNRYEAKYPKRWDADCPGWSYVDMFDEIFRPG